jgi:hypothetical protein
MLTCIAMTISADYGHLSYVATHRLLQAIRYKKNCLKIIMQRSYPMWFECVGSSRIWSWVQILESPFCAVFAKLIFPPLTLGTAWVRQH